MNDYDEMIRFYHLIAIDENTKREYQLTPYPMLHDECCTMRDNFTQHPRVTMVLREVLL